MCSGWSSTGRPIRSSPPGRTGGTSAPTLSWGPRMARSRSGGVAMRDSRFVRRAQVRSDFDTTVDQLVALAEAGVDENVIGAMVKSGKVSVPAAAPDLGHPFREVAVGEGTDADTEDSSGDAAEAVDRNSVSRRLFELGRFFTATVAPLPVVALEPRLGGSTQWSWLR